MEPYNISDIKYFKEFLSIKCLPCFWVFLFVNGWYLGHLENEGVFQNYCQEDDLFSTLSRQVHITMMLGMAQLQRKQPFWGLSMAVYEYTTSALCPENSLDGRVFFWFHSIVCGLLCGITSSLLLIINSHFQANIYQRLFSMRLIFFSNIACL